MSEITVALQKLRERTRAKVKKAASKSEVNLEIKPNGENLENAEKEGGKKNKIPRVHTAPVKLGKSKEKTDEWDAGKTPPSRFQQRKGSVYATPKSRDSHIDQHADRDAKFHKLHDKKFGAGKARTNSLRSEACFGAVF